MKDFLSNSRADRRADFLTGLVVVLPVAVYMGVVMWFLGMVSHFTDALLLLVPKGWTRNGEGPLDVYRVI